MADKAALDTRWQEATPSRLAIEILRGAAEEIVRHKAAGVPMNSDAIPVKASVLLSLLDRIEELEAAHLNCPSLEEHGYGSHE